MRSERTRLAQFARALLVLALPLAFATFARKSAAFTHVVEKTETLAQIAERVYGEIQYEKILVAANALDAQGGSPIVAGQRLEIPALDHYRVVAGDTWSLLAQRLLGDSDRATVFARANDTMPWLPPAEGAEIVVPYNLRYLVAQSDTIVTVAQRYMGEKTKAWVLDQYNHLKNQPIRRGDVVLIPLLKLPLTDAGRAEASAMGVQTRTQAAGSLRDLQRKIDQDIPGLLADVRGGRYVDAVAHGEHMLASGDLTKPELAAIHRQLTEAFAALDAVGLAAASCAQWRTHDPKSMLDPTMLSPKILAACSKGGH